MSLEQIIEDEDKVFNFVEESDAGINAFTSVEGEGETTSKIVEGTPRVAPTIPIEGENQNDAKLAVGHMNDSTYEQRDVVNGATITSVSTGKVGESKRTRITSKVYKSGEEIPEDATYRPVEAGDFMSRKVDGTSIGDRRAEDTYQDYLAMMNGQLGKEEFIAIHGRHMEAFWDANNVSEASRDAFWEKLEERQVLYHRGVGESFWKAGGVPTMNTGGTTPEARAEYQLYYDARGNDHDWNLRRKERDYLGQEDVDFRRSQIAQRSRKIKIENLEATGGLNYPEPDIRRDTTGFKPYVPQKQEIQPMWDEEGNRLNEAAVIADSSRYQRQQGRTEEDVFMDAATTSSNLEEEIIRIRNRK
tara:strand:- start:252 stop:1331 length:1080 start_codon:yes stop_codon:yes gene_type:complete